MNSPRKHGDTAARQPHAVLDHRSRLLKAAKIGEILKRRTSLSGARVLDVGTGSGLIAEYFLDLVGPAGKVFGTDMVNQLRTGRVEFRQADSTELPFEDKSFDIVISNHVIEHVGRHDEQLNHLREIARVLAPDGLLYLAMPNRWALVEPHFRLPFLSWLPEPMRSPYVKVAGRGAAYDCTPLKRNELTRLFADTSLAGSEITLEVLRVMARLEMPKAFGMAVLSCPEFIMRCTLGLIPTIVFLAAKHSTDPHI